MASLPEVEIPTKVRRLLRDIKPLFFEKVIKYTDRNEAKSRFILITPTWFFCLKKTFFSGFSIKRGFELSHIHGLIHSSSTHKFLLKVDPQIRGDYRLESDCSSRAITVLLAIRSDFRVWIVDDDVEIYQRQKKRLPKVDVNLLVLPKESVRIPE